MTTELRNSKIETNGKQTEFETMTATRIRHDHLGYYACTDAEGRHEDEGNPSVGFDGREHWETLDAAREAAGLPKEPTLENWRQTAFDLFDDAECTIDDDSEVMPCEEGDGAWVRCWRFVRKTDVPGFEA